MADKTIPFFGVSRQYQSLREEILDVTDRVYSSGKVLDGENTIRFEDEMKKRTNRAHAIAVNSCSTALMFTYLYYALTQNKVVALPAYSFIATANAPKMTGFNLKFTDVDIHGLMNLDELRLRDDNVGVISYVNLYGNILDYDKLVISSSFFNSKIPIIEDAAQSFGATYKGIPSGKLGDVSCLSFDPTKNLPNYGSGGMILTDDHDIAYSALNMRDNGRGSNFESPGMNCRMSDSDCAQMLVKLKYFDVWQARRKKIAEFYSDCLHALVEVPVPNPQVEHAWHKYVIVTADQFALRSHLADEQIDTKIHYNSTLLGLADYNDESQFVVANKLAVTSVSLPIYPELTDEEVCRIVETIQNFYK